MLEEADLTHANLTNADLKDADLTNAILKDADLTGARLVRVKLDDADLQGARFIETDLDGTSLRKARFGRTVIAADLSAANQESLKQTKHLTSSHITFGSVRAFNGNLPRRFLQLCQLDPRIIDLFSRLSEHHHETEGPRMQTIRIFLASSEELRTDRDAFDLYFRQQNDWLRDEGIYLKIVRWENFLDAMAETRLQDEYNREVRSCDIFVSLFKTKTGKYTEEEFDAAHHAFIENGKPLIYTFFMKPGREDVNREDLVSLWNFQDKLKELEHFYTEFNNTEDLKLKFKDQLQRLRAEKRI